MNYIITGGTGFIGTHLTHLILERYPDAKIWNLDIVKPGTPNPVVKNYKPAVRDGEKLVISIAIGYGADSGKPHKAKDMEQVIDAKGDRPLWFNKGVEMALLAPTAINQQKFEIGLNDDGAVTFTDKGGPYSKVDLGIVKYHFEVGAEYVKSQGANI